MFSLQMMEMSERLKGLKKLRNGILLPDAEADLPPAFDHCTLSTFILHSTFCHLTIKRNIAKGTTDPEG